MRQLVSRLTVMATLAFSLAQAHAAPLERVERTCTSCRSLDLAINGFGVSFGNSTRFTGLRFNLVDRDVEEINGINLTFWKPGKSPDAVIRGVALGLIAPQGDRIEGISAGIAAVLGISRISGLSAAGLAVVSEGEISGIAIGGLATVADGGASGIISGGLASVVEGGMSGISFGGLASVVEGGMSGVSAGGLASVTEGSLSGISFSGLAAVVDGDANGIMAAGLASVIDGRLRGFGAAGWSVRSGEISGAALAGALVKAHGLTGFSAGAVNYFDEYHIGLSLGIVNIAQRLSGIQLGLINIAKNNSSPFRVLPIINAHFE